MIIAHHKIKLKLLAVQLLALLPLLLFIFYLFDLWYDTRRLLVIEQNRATARLIALAVRHTLTDSQATDAATIRQFRSELGKEFDYDETKTIILLNDKGESIFSIGNAIPPQKEAKLSDNMHVLKALGGDESIIENERLPIANEPMIGAAVPVETPSYQWAVVSVEPMQAVFTPLITMQSVVWGIIFTGLLFSIALITYILRKIRIIF